jgi:mucin-19
MPFFGSLGTIGRFLIVAGVVIYLFSEISRFVGNGLSGYFDGVERFYTPNGLTVDSVGNVYVADQANQRIRKITPAGLISTVAGNGTTTFADGTGTNATFNQPTGVAIDSSGNIYVADRSNNRIRKITSAGVVTTFAGSSAGSANGTGTNATFNAPRGVTVDSEGNVYVADGGNNCIRKITPEGVVTTLAGGTSGSLNGTGTNARFWNPQGVAVDSSGNIYVADRSNNRIRKITSAGVVTTLAGNTVGYQDGTGTNALFNQPYGITVDSAGTVYVADTLNYRIRKITSGGVVTTLAGSGTATFADGTGTNASFNTPQGIAVDSSGNVYVGDTNNDLIRKITPTGLVTTLAGSEFAGFTDSLQNGGVSGALLNLPRAVAVDSSSTMYVADTTNHRIRKITSGGVVTTLAGSGTATFADGTGTNASFNTPQGIAVDSAGNVYVGDTLNNRIRKITPEGLVTTLAGSGTAQFGDGTGTNASFNNPYGVTVDSAGIVYVIDKLNYRVRKITSAGVVTTLAGNGTAQYLEGTGTAARFLNPFGIVVNSAGTLMYVTDSNYIRIITSAGVTSFLAGQATAGSANGTGVNASFNGPREITLLAAGTSVYVADTGNHIIRRVTTDFGVTTKYSGFGGAGFRESPVANVQYNNPSGIAVNSAGLVYVADTNNNRIRRIAAGSDNTGVVTTVVGTSTAGYTDGGGWFNSPFGIATDWDGNMYVADTINNRIRKITSTTVVTTFAGNGLASSGNGTGTDATFNQPRGVAIGSDGTVYVADTSNNRIRRITFDGIVSYMAGQQTAGSTNGTGTNAMFNTPNTVTVDLAENVYVADTGNHRIRKVTQANVVTTLAGTTQGFQDGVGTNARFDTPRGIVADIYGNVYVADTNNHDIRKISSDGTVTTLAGSTAGYADGIGTNARFNFPTNLSIDALGTLYVADQTNNRIRKINPSTGVVSTLAGDGTAGFTSSRLNTPQGITVDRFRNAYVGDTGNHSICRIKNAYTLPENNRVVKTFYLGGFSFPGGIAVDSMENIYVADIQLHRIFKITSAGVKTTLAGSGTATFADGTGVSASFNQPYGVTVDSMGNVYVGDRGNNRIRKITPAGVVTTIAGDATGGFRDGLGPLFRGPRGVALDSARNIYVADTDNNSIRRVTLGGVASSLAGNGTYSFADGIGTNASFKSPRGVALDSARNIYVADTDNHSIRRVTSLGSVTTLAGNGTPGSTDGTGTNARFYSPSEVTVDSMGNVYVSDLNNHRIRKITPEGVVTTLAGNTVGYQDGTGTNTSFNLPYGITNNSVGFLYITDYSNYAIRKIGTNQLPLNLGVVTTHYAFSSPSGITVDPQKNLYIASGDNIIYKMTAAGVVTGVGSGQNGFQDGNSDIARFWNPQGVAIDFLGNIYVADTTNHRIRKISAGVVSTFAGSGNAQSFDGTGTNARFWNPTGVAVDSARNVYVVESGSHRIRKITPEGVVTTLAGNTVGYQDGTGTNALFNTPFGITIDSLGNLYVADTYNNRIRKITPAGVVTTFVGYRTLGSGDGIGTNAVFNRPSSVAFDYFSGNFYVADTNNNRIRKITPEGLVTTVAGNGTSTLADGTGTNAQFNQPKGITVDSDGNVYVSDTNNGRIRKIQ